VGYFPIVAAGDARWLAGRESCLTCWQRRLGAPLSRLRVTSCHRRRAMRWRLPIAGRAVGLLLLGHVGPGSRLKPRPFGEAMADHLGRGRVGSLLDILTQESNAGRSRGVPEPKGRSSAYKHPLLFNVDEEATRKRNGGYGDQS